ncbi:hypothetical protein CEXT_253241 [Caerostris extrusa]|uniref:Uncharacterized protein n=1 Tax=Caerostris extrusa TaxID=172846 RepID=A0AAV4TC71_CAEEX|nr:hypothetical protein CEXT_253241 [Caerostris extrusa]
MQTPWKIKPIVHSSECLYERKTTSSWSPRLNKPKAKLIKKFNTPIKTGPIFKSSPKIQACASGYPSSRPRSSIRRKGVRNQKQTPFKNIPIVHSQNVFMFCQALGLKTKLTKN